MDGGVVAHSWWPEAGGSGHKRALCLVAAGAGVLTGGAFLLCSPAPSADAREWPLPNEDDDPSPWRRLSGSAQKLFDPEPEPEPEPELEPETELESEFALGPAHGQASKPEYASSPPRAANKPRRAAPGPPAIDLKSPQISPRSPGSSPSVAQLSSPIISAATAGNTPAPLSRGISWGSAAFDRARQTSPTELRKAFDRMSQSQSKDLWKLGEPGGDSKVLSREDFIHVCTQELDLDLNVSEIERLFDQLDEAKAGKLNFTQFRQAVNRSSFFKTIASNYNSAVRARRVICRAFCLTPALAVSR